CKIEDTRLARRLACQGSTTKCRSGCGGISARSDTDRQLASPSNGPGTSFATGQAICRSAGRQCVCNTRRAASTVRGAREQDQRKVQCNVDVREHSSGTASAGFEVLG